METEEKEHLNSQWIAMQWQLITGSTDTYVIYATWLTEYSLHQNKTVLQIKDVNGNYVIMDQVNNCIYGKVSMKRRVVKKSSSLTKDMNNKMHWT